MKRILLASLCVLLSVHSITHAYWDQPAVHVEQWRDILGDSIVQGSLRKLIWRSGLASDPRAKSKFREALERAGDFTGDLIGSATSNLSQQVQRGNITSGQALAKGFKSIVDTTADVFIPHAPKIGGGILVFYAIYKILKVGSALFKKWVVIRMNQPRLLREILQPRQISRSLEDLHYTPETKERMTGIIHMAQSVIKHSDRAKFENIMLWGHPGTGKTAFVEVIAKEAGMTLFKTSGGDFAKLRGKDLEQIDALFRRIKANHGSWYQKQPVLLFIDEMEELFGSRAQETMSEDARNVLSKLLVELSEPNSHLMLIGATNRPEDIDEAMHRRMPQQIEVGLPDQAGREAIFKLYVNKFFTKDREYSTSNREMIRNLFDDKCIMELAQQVGTIAPAEIEDVMLRIKNRSLAHDSGLPTEALIAKTVAEKCKQLEDRAKGFVRST